MIFDANVDHALQFLNQDICKCYHAGSEFSIVETKKDGEACVHVMTAFPCIHIRDADKRHIEFLDLKKCADHIVLKYDQHSDVWDIHIFELKRTISKTKWEETIIPQFHGGLVNTYALCGILHIQPQHIRRIYAHCGYRRNISLTSLVEQKIPLGESVQNTKWLEDPFTLDYMPNQKIVNIAIRLSEEDGAGEFVLPSDE